MSNLLKKLLNADVVIITVTVLAMLFVTATANAAWLTFEENDKTYAVLHGEIQEADAVVPDADAYLINSHGGQIWAGYKIAEQLKGKPVTFKMAHSIAAVIVLETGAAPIDGASLGFHWASSKVDVPQDTLDYVNGLMLKSIVTNMKPQIASKVIAGMNQIWDRDQSTTVVQLCPTTLEVTIVTLSKVN